MNTPKIKYIHYRDRDSSGAIESHGGATVAFIDGVHGVEYAVARCNYSDNFNKAYGRAKAAGRLASPKYRRVSSFKTADDNFYKYLRDRFNCGIIE